MIEIPWCAIIQASHLTYVLLVYYIIPFILTDVFACQLGNLIVISCMIIHWKLLDDNCVLDVAENKVCGSGSKRYNYYMATSPLTFSNASQLFLSFAVLIGSLRVFYNISVPVPIRVLILAFNYALIYNFIPLSHLSTDWK
jgi:hypothetical protein